MKAEEMFPSFSLMLRFILENLKSIYASQGKAVERSQTYHCLAKSSEFDNVGSQYGLVEPLNDTRFILN